jgi:hypothetical protein
MPWNYRETLAATTTPPETARPARPAR